MPVRRLQPVVPADRTAAVSAPLEVPPTRLWIEAQPKLLPLAAMLIRRQQNSLPSNGVLTSLGQNGADGYVYGKNSIGTPPAGPQVTTANRNLTITANAKPTNFGGVYGHTLTFSEPGSNKLATMTTVDPTGLLVATPIEGDPSNLNVSEYKGY